MYPVEYSQDSVIITEGDVGSVVFVMERKWFVYFRKKIFSSYFNYFFKYLELLIYIFLFFENENTYLFVSLLKSFISLLFLWLKTERKMNSKN